MYRSVLKPLLDRTAAATLLILLLPVMALTALAVRVNLGSPVLFSQDRPGQHGRIFRLYKFRTMGDERDENGVPLPDEKRLGAFGRGLRSLSLDELPQLFNILRGEMSFIGPRPLLVAYLPRYDQAQSRRHEVLPGITGLAQVRGRNRLSWPERFALDVEYVDSITLALDLKIAWLTLAKVAKREGVSGQNHVTMSAFLGNGDRVYILGGGGHGRVVAESAKRMGLRVEGFIDQDPSRGIRYEQFLQRAKIECFGVVPAIGNNRTRQRRCEELRRDGVMIVSAIDPSAVVSKSAHVGSGVVVLPLAVINASARIEDGAIINSQATVEHDSVVGAYAHISPGAVLSGGAVVSPLAHVGALAVLIPLASVGKAATIGAGAVVRGAVPPFVTAVGVPARVVRIHDEEIV